MKFPLPKCHATKKAIAIKNAVAFLVEDIVYSPIKYRETEGIKDNHANALLGVGAKDGELYVCSEIYCHEKDISEIIKMAQERNIEKRVEMFCDSAEPDRISMWRKAGYRARAVNKGGSSGSVKAQIDYLKGCKIHIHPSCVNTIKEIQQWKWKKDTSTGKYIDEPVEFFDDAMAALRYSVERLRRGPSIEVLR